MRKQELVLGLLALAAVAAADAVDDVKAGTDLDLDLRGMTYSYSGAMSGSGTVTDDQAPASCVAKNPDTLNFTLDLASLGFPGGGTVSMTGTKLSPTKVKWNTSTTINQCVTVDLGSGPVNILIKTVTGQMTANAANMDPFFDSLCGHGYNTGLDDTNSDAESYFNVVAYALCVESIFTRVNLQFRTIDYVGLAGVPRGNVKPESATLLQGEPDGGGVTDLFQSDDSRLTFFNDSVTLTAELEVGTFAPQAALGTVALTVETSAARSGLAQAVSMFRWDTSAFVVLGGSVSTGNDATQTYQASPASAFVDPATRAMTARLRWTPINDEAPAQDGWLHSVDMVRWFVAP